jgi:WD40 repeat protein
MGADGRPLLASGRGGGTVRLWDPATGTPVGEPLPGHPGYTIYSETGEYVTAYTGMVYAVAFGVGADGRLVLATAGHGAVRLWDPATGTPVGKPLDHKDTVRSVAFGVAADGRRLLASASDDRKVRLWDPTTGTAIGKLLRRTTPVAVATHNTQLAIADAEGITVIEVMDSAG